MDTGPSNEFIIAVLGISVAISAAYALGRIHQQLRTGDERDDAFKEGYDQATQSLWALAARPAPNHAEPLDHSLGIRPTGRHSTDAATRELHLGRL